MNDLEKKLLRKLRNQRYYQNKKQQSNPLQITEAGLHQCTQCEVFQSEDQFAEVGTHSHIGIPSTDPTICANCHWYNKTYGVEVWKERHAKRKAAERAKAYRDRVAS